MIRRKRNPLPTNEDTVIATLTIDDTPIVERCRRRVVRRLMPYLFLLYIIAYLDRANVGYANLQMKGAAWLYRCCLWLWRGRLFHRLLYP